MLATLNGKLPLDGQQLIEIMGGIVMPSHGALSKAGKVRSITGGELGLRKVEGK